MPSWIQTPSVGRRRLAHSNLLWVLVPLATLGCGISGEGDSTDASGRSIAPSAIESWRLSETPLLEIGVREGAEPYQLHRARGSLRLGDGRIVVVNGGSQELRFFGPDGQYLSAVGGSGEGPGEFRFPTRIRKSSGDSLQVWDQSLMRVSFFDSQGAFLGSHQLEPTREVFFPGDEWLHGRFWIDSPLRPSAREPVRRAVQYIPVPDSLVGLLFLKVTHQGRIWVSEVRPPADTAITWDVYDLQGRARARVVTPSRFEPHEIGADYVLGRFMDELDINYIRLYALEKPANSPTGPGLDLSPPTVSPRPRLVRSPEEEEALAPLKNLMKWMASLQEINYAEHYSYTADVSDLFSDTRQRVPDGVEARVLFASPEGWMGTATDSESGDYCALAYGFFIPMGWTPGMVICP